MSNSKNIIVMLAFASSVMFLLFVTKINDFPLILGFFTIAFLSYAYILKEEIPWKQLLYLGWGLRIAAVFAFPGLSDDIYRFIWDGWLIMEGINPFSALPSELNIAIPEYQQFLLEKMNSPNYYSVYPTVLQAIFALCVWIIPDNILLQSIFFKLLFLAFEIITFRYSLKLLEVLQWDRKLYLIYFLNPLIIIELMGNLHMELVMISGFAVFIYYLWILMESQKGLLAGTLSLALSIGAKLITVLVAPFLLKRFPIKKTFSFSIILGILLLTLFIPMFLLTYENFGKGLDLYFQKFEFNASIYYLLREVGYWHKGYNIIGSLGPFLAGISAISILLLAYFEKETSIASLCRNLTFALTIYFSLSTTVHPWYTSLLVFMAVFSRLKYPVIWSFLALFSYSKYYSNETYYIYFVALEYTILWTWMYIEWKKFRQDNSKIKPKILAM